jgi:hypothetical protein
LVPTFFVCRNSIDVKWDQLFARIRSARRRVFVFVQNHTATLFLPN